MTIIINNSCCPSYFCPRSKDVREFLAELIGTFILMVSECFLLFTARPKLPNRVIFGINSIFSAVLSDKIFHRFLVSPYTLKVKYGPNMSFI